MAHTTCLAAARHDLCAKRGWDVEQRGLFGAPPLRILSSGLAHGSIDRAVRFLGLGLSHVVKLPANDCGQLEPQTLEQALAAAPTDPTIIILQAGDINTGAYDSFASLIPIAKRYRAWVHVDGAIGLWVAASARHRHLVAGVEAADSWATDGHKWLNVPYDCGYAFVAHPEAHRGAMSHRASYLTHDADARDQIDWNLEWSRRARGFPTYAALRQLGKDGVAALIDRCCLHAHELISNIGRLPGAEILWTPTINQGLVRFLDGKSQAVDRDHDRRTDAIIAAVCASGEAFFTGTDFRGRRAMRVSVCNWQTSERDIERAVQAIAVALRDSK